MVQICREWQKSLLQQYPEQFSQLSSFDVLKGWSSILEEVFSRVDVALTAEELKEFAWSDIKEKWGALRMTHNGSDAIDEIVDWAEEVSLLTCDCCGRPGRLVKQGWWATRCGRCG
jgi:hypothetical protein